MTQATQNVIPELAAVAWIWSSTKLPTSDVTIPAQHGKDRTFGYRNSLIC